MESARERLTANLWLVVSRFFVIAALGLLVFLGYAERAGAPALNPPRQGVMFVGLYLVLAALALAWFVALHVSERSRTLQLASFVQVTIDLLFITAFALFSNENMVLVFLGIPVVASAGLWGRRGPLFCAGAAIFLLFLLTTFHSALTLLIAPLGVSFSLGYSSYLVDPALLIVGISLALQSAFASQLGRWVSERALLLKTARSHEPVPRAPTQGESVARTRQELIAKNFELEKANEHLATLDRAKSDFVSVATHQLRTPLSGIKWAFDMLQKGNFGPVNPDQWRVLQKGLESTERTIRIVNEILSIDQMEHQTLEYQFSYRDLREIIAASIHDFENQAKTKGVTLIFERPERLPELMLDADKLRMVIDNLLENAIKYTDAGGTVDVCINTEWLNTATPHVEVTVTDSGIGISQAAQEEIFTKFYRAPNARKQEPNGTGIGLYIAKSIVEGHRGTIWFESEEGRGTTFHYTLPVHQELAQAL